MTTDISLKFPLVIMPPARNAKIWNDDLVRAFEARYDLAKREGKKTLWKERMMKFQALMDKNIYVTKLGKSINLKTR